ncbi:MAG: hypothetical protein ACE5HO_15945 [bacterium]
MDKLVSKEQFQKEVGRLASQERLDAEVAKLATKEELAKVNTTLESVAVQVAVNTTDIKGLKFKMGEVVERLDSLENRMDQRFDMVMEVLDGIVVRLDRHDTERAAAEHTFLRHGNRLDDHESAYKRWKSSWVQKPDLG